MPLPRKRDIWKEDVTADGNHAVHIERVATTAFIAADHDATERYGVMTLGAHLAAHFGIDCEFVELDNPV